MTELHKDIPNKVVIFADSQALPRGKTWGNLPVELTYPWLMQQLLKQEHGDRAPVIIERGMRNSNGRSRSL
jgi:hypothetical protein